MAHPELVFVEQDSCHSDFNRRFIEALENELLSFTSPLTPGRNGGSIGKSSIITAVESAELGSKCTDNK